MIFYVGKTNNPDRRLKEHQYLSTKPDELTNKYVFIRQLDQVEIPWYMTIISEDINIDEDSEFEWILLFARHNIKNKISFLDGSPLTNLKNGDMLSEMVDNPTIVTSQDIKNYRAKKRLPVGKLSIAKQYNTWTAVDQASAEKRLLDRMLKFFNVKERDLAKAIREETGIIATQRILIGVLFDLDIDESWTAKRLQEYLEFIEEAEELGLI